MKELYISPDLEILCFAPAEKLASNFGYDTGESANFFSLTRNGDNGVSMTETQPGDYTTPVNPGESLT